MKTLQPTTPTKTAERFNRAFGIKAVTAMVTSDETIFGFRCLDSANEAVARLGIGRVWQAFSGAWCASLPRADIERKIVSLRGQA